MRAKLAIATALSLALALGACGSGGDDSTQAPSLSEAAGPRVVPLKVSGGGSAQFHVRGGDNSIQDYGHESGDRELKRAAGVVHGYFTALAREEWADACGRLGREEVAQIREVAASSPKAKGCASALEALFGGVTAAEGREATAVDAVSLRRAGAQAFLIYRGAGGKPYFASLRREGGGWGVAGLSPTPLP